jgi:hypothetical protein
LSFDIHVDSDNVITLGKLNIYHLL